MVEINEKYIGSVCEMSSLSNELVCIGKLSALPSPDNEFKLSVASSMDSFPVLAHHTPLKVHIRSAKYDSIFLLGKVSVCKSNIMTFSEIECVAQTEKRDAFRVSYSQKSAFYLKGDRKPAGILAFADISLGGFLCRSREKLSTGKLYNVELPMREGTYLFTFRVVRNLLSDRQDVFTYGCQFVDIGEKQLDALARFVFTLQKENISKLRQHSR